MKVIIGIMYGIFIGWFLLIPIALATSGDMKPGEVRCTGVTMRK